MANGAGEIEATGRDGLFVRRLRVRTLSGLDVQVARNALRLSGTIITFANDPERLRSVGSDILHVVQVDGGVCIFPVGAVKDPHDDGKDSVLDGYIAKTQVDGSPSRQSMTTLLIATMVVDEGFSAEQVSFDGPDVAIRVGQDAGVISAIGVQDKSGNVAGATIVGEHYERTSQGGRNPDNVCLDALGTVTFILDSLGVHY